RMQSTDEANQAAFPLDASGLPRMQGWMVAWDEAERIGSAGRTQQRLDIGFQIVEVDTLTAVGPTFRQATASDHTGEHRLLLEFVQLADKSQTAFEQANARLLTVEVVLQRLDQTRPQRRTHGGHVSGDRISQLQRLDTGIEQIEQLGSDEAVSDRFLIATGNQQATQRGQLGTGLSLGLRSQTRLRVAHRQTVVTVKTAQLFDQINFQADVEAVARHTDLPLACTLSGNTQTQRREQALDFGAVHIHAQHLADAFGTQGDRRHARQVGLAADLNDRTCLAADDLQQQRSRSLHGLARQLRIHATLEAMRSIGMQAIGTSFAGDSDVVEEGAFQEQIARRGTHATVLTAHHTGDGQGAIVIGDYQGVGTQADFLAVQQDQLLALFRHAHADAAVDLGEIEGVHRLPQF